MKRLFGGSLLFFVALGTAAAGHAQVATSHFCNNQLIAGVYGFTVEGTKFPTPPPPATPVGPSGQQVGVAMTEFDGQGNLKQIDSVTIGGHVVADFIKAPALATGKYTVNPDCTGTFNLIFTDGRPEVVVNFVVVNNGNEIDTVVMTAGGNQGVLATGSIGKRRFVGLF